LSLTLKENTILNFVYYIHIVEIPTNKGANPYKLNISRMGKSPSEIYTRLHIYIQITCYCVYVTLAFDTGFESDPLLLTKKTTMFTVLCRHVHSD